MRRILIRLPNWLGDMAMSTAFVRAVAARWPEAELDLIARQGIEVLLDFFPPHRQRHVYSKATHPGLRGVWRFGRALSHQSYDAYFTLPDSFSTAVMGFASGATQRIGYRDEMRSLLMTRTYPKRSGLHRVEEYVDLLRQFTSEPLAIPSVTLGNALTAQQARENLIVININSKAVSRRLPVTKAIAIIDAVRAATTAEIMLIGAPMEVPHVQSVMQGLRTREGISSRAGQTSLRDLIELSARARVFLTTDSGPAHVANAAGTHTIVLFGAGNERNTAPYNAGNRQIIRLGQLPCEPCLKNHCRLYGVPKCLTELGEATIVAAVTKALSSGA